MSSQKGLVDPGEASTLVVAVPHSKSAEQPYIVYVTYRIMNSGQTMQMNGSKDAAFCRRRHGYWGGVRS